MRKILLKNLYFFCLQFRNYSEFNRNKDRKIPIETSNFNEEKSKDIEKNKEISINIQNDSSAFVPMHLRALLSFKSVQLIPEFSSYSSKELRSDENFIYRSKNLMNRRLSLPFELLLRHYTKTSSQWEDALNAFFALRESLKKIWRPLPGDYYKIVGITDCSRYAFLSLLKVMREDFSASLLDKGLNCFTQKERKRINDQFMKDICQKYEFYVKKQISLPPIKIRKFISVFPLIIEKIKKNKWQEAVVAYQSAIKMLEDPFICKNIKTTLKRNSLYRYHTSLNKIIAKLLTVKSWEYALHVFMLPNTKNALSISGLREIMQLSWEKALFLSASIASRNESTSSTIPSVMKIHYNGLKHIPNSWRVAMNIAKETYLDFTYIKGRKENDLLIPEHIRASSILLQLGNKNVSKTDSSIFFGIIYMALINVDFSYKHNLGRSIFKGGQILNRAKSISIEKWGNSIPSLPNYGHYNIFHQQMRILHNKSHPYGGVLLKNIDSLPFLVDLNKGYAIVDTNMIEKLIVNYKIVEKSVLELLQSNNNSIKSVIFIVPWVTLLESFIGIKVRAFRKKNLKDFFKCHYLIQSLAADADVKCGIFSPIASLYGYDNLSSSDIHIASVAMAFDISFRFANVIESTNTEKDHSDSEKSEDSKAGKEFFHKHKMTNSYLFYHISRAINRTTQSSNGNVIVLSHDLELRNYVLRAGLSIYPPMTS